MVNVHKNRSLVLFLILFVLTILITGCDDDDRRRHPDRAHRPGHHRDHKSPHHAHDRDHRPNYDRDYCKPPYRSQAEYAPNAVVESFYDEVKNNNLQKAAAYVSPASKKNVSLLKAQADIKQLQAFNLITVQQVAVQDDYAVVRATLQKTADTTQYVTKPVGLERIDDDWYIVDYDQIYHSDKYTALREMFDNH